MSKVLKRCIQRLLEGSEERAEFVDRFLLSLLSHCAKDQDHLQAMKDIEDGCTCECATNTNKRARLILSHKVLTLAEFELQKIPAMACLAVRSRERLFHLPATDQIPHRSYRKSAIDCTRTRTGHRPLNGSLQERIRRLPV